MLVQNPTLPCFAVAGDYCPSSSTRSTHTQPLAQFFGLPVPIRIVLNPEQSLTQSHFSVFPPGQSVDTQSHHQISFSGDCLSNNFTPIAVNMPRHSRSNENQDIDPPVFTEPLGPVATGCKRDASALSANCTIPPITTTTTTTANLPLDPNDQCTIYLPPKPKESERMMHIQRWVNHLPWNITMCDASGRSRVPYPIPVRSHIDEDRELTPPPGRTYLTRLPFTAEEQQAMVRFFPSHTNQYRHQHQTNAAPDPQPRYHPFPNHCPNQQPSNNHNHFPSSQRPSQEAGNVFPSVRHIPEYINETSRKRGQEDVGGSRLFADWETRLISVCGTLPSLSEVRSRIASSKLKETRTATAVRSKIRRMQSSGTWLKYQ
ncbi:unnamed protein product [Heterobilharzia americana]|nr:unnamed protein product [Heterobilharzia americana]